MDNLYREINGITYIAPNAEDRKQRFQFVAMCGMIVGVAIAALILL